MRRSVSVVVALVVSLACLFGCSSRDSDGDDGSGEGDDSPEPLTGIAQSGGQDPTIGSPFGGGGARDKRIAPFVASPCDKVDIVFAVDGSQSMAEELQAMRQTVFPAFAQRLRQVGQGVEDFRVGVVDGCPNPARLHTRGRRGQCDFAGGNMWIESGSDRFNEEIECVGDLYQGDQSCSGNNDDEQPASAIAAALENAGTGDANEGFVRDDALLIAIAITDEDEQPTTGPRNAQAVYERLVDVAGGDPKRMVFLGIGGSSDECVGPYGDALEARMLREIANMFDRDARGVFWDLCAGRLEDGLSEAFQVIEKACNDFPPTPLEPCGGLDVTCNDTDPPPDRVFPDAGGPI